MHLLTQQFGKQSECIYNSCCVSYRIMDLLLNSIVVTDINPSQVDNVVDVIPLTVFTFDMPVKLLCVSSVAKKKRFDALHVEYWLEYHTI